MEGETLNNRDLIPQLPDELWGRIADFLRTKEWVHISSTCRTFHRLQCRRLRLDVRSPDALAWTEKHWANARVLVLNFSAADLDWVLSPEVVRLDTLVVYGMVFHRAVTDNSAVAFASWVTWILANCHILHFLGLTGRVRFSIPPLEGLHT